MPIFNRDLDFSEQRVALNYAVNPQASTGASTVLGSLCIATGATITFGMIPFVSTLVDAYVAGTGLSGSPTLDIRVVRNTAGGATYISGLFQAALAVALPGTSGPLRASLAASGSSLLFLQAGDVIEGRLAGTTSAVSSLVVNLVIKASADAKAFFNQVATS